MNVRRLLFLTAFIVILILPSLKTENQNGTPQYLLELEEFTRELISACTQQLNRDFKKKFSEQFPQNLIKKLIKNLINESFNGLTKKIPEQCAKKFAEKFAENPFQLEKILVEDITETCQKMLSNKIVPQLIKTYSKVFTSNLKGSLTQIELVSNQFESFFSFKIPPNGPTGSSDENDPNH
ncbi:hypothetical protein DI09_238p10 [Mitosporidium daphniae]|uniref:Uncharacterized protein n=1 Tax=Mitosporidium daphniae TaxID=1485682 RepID=A0A098VSB7_9MICR|nr:uncharacterized protein DI09_238p10 [Mitosporidium daphniae]KGG51953.1 hypothetical protein DI09_238p10 [Mitosporidium daphniae]|eukprot:XP_013238389.1 uncharacterized protein DI09_238p10 [Mitosporidium daphniae]